MGGPLIHGRYALAEGLYNVDQVTHGSDARELAGQKEGNVGREKQG
jgi:hypothetical protein